MFSGIQVFGLQPGHAVCKHAAHGVERSKDDDSISGVCCCYGSLQRLHGVGIGGGLGVLAGV